MTYITISINIIIFSLLLLFSSGGNRRMLDGVWVGVYLTNIGAAGTIMYQGWHWAAYLLAAFFFVFVIVPFALLIAGRFYDSSGRNDLAARILRIAYFLHPAAGWQFQARFAAAFSQSSLDEKSTALAHLEGTISGVDAKDWETLTRINRLRMLNDWQSLLAIPEPLGEKSEAVIPWATTRLEAFAETGNLNGAAELYFDNAEWFNEKISLVQVLFPLLIFSGKYRLVEALVQCRRRDGHKSDETESWVINLARLISGQEDARAALEALIAATPDPLQRSLMQRRLDTPLPNPASLKPQHSEAIDRLTETLLAEAASRPPSRKPLVTITLLALIIVTYVLQLLIGGEGMHQRLVDAGGMLPAAVMNGEWWRLITALFLHGGPFHVIANCSVLLILGVVVEQQFGSRRMLIIYGLGGVLSSLMVFMAMTGGYVRQASLVGASGAILALFGAYACHEIIIWARQREMRNWKSFWLTLKPIGVGVMWQAVYDTIMPANSSIAHVSGFVTGAVIGAIFILLRR